MLYSVKMRASAQGLDGNGEHHISGAERIVKESELDGEVLAMLHRAQSHPKGKADCIHVKVEPVAKSEISYVPLLSIREKTTQTPEEGEHVARQELRHLGVSDTATDAAFSLLRHLPESMRGAIVMDAISGRRLDDKGLRGIRCSNMDCENTADYDSHMASSHLTNLHPKEALVLASKVASHPSTMAELCWSDDPDYVTGYVASSAGYVRITVMKHYGDPIGGRVFFVHPDTNIVDYEAYLQHQPVLIQVTP